MPLKKGEALPDDAIMYVIMPIPRAATKLKMKCKVIYEGEKHDVVADFNIEDIQQFRKDFLDNVGDDEFHIRYTLTDKGREMMNKMLESGAE